MHGFRKEILGLVDRVRSLENSIESLRSAIAKDGRATDTVAGLASAVVGGCAIAAAAVGSCADAVVGNSYQNQVVSRSRTGVFPTTSSAGQRTESTGALQQEVQTLSERVRSQERQILAKERQISDLERQITSMDRWVQ